MTGSSGDHVDDLLEALADSRRRHALSCLRRHRQLTLADLAEQVTVRERGEALPEVESERVRDVYFSLYHNHVPKLEAAGLVRYHQDGDIVDDRERLHDAVDRVSRELGALVTE